MEFGVKMFMLLGAMLSSPIVGIACYYIGKRNGKKAQKELEKLNNKCGDDKCACLP